MRVVIFLLGVAREESLVCTRSNRVKSKTATKSVPRAQSGTDPRVEKWMKADEGEAATGEVVQKSQSAKPEENDLQNQLPTQKKAQSKSASYAPLLLRRKLETVRRKPIVFELLHY